MRKYEILSTVERMSGKGLAISHNTSCSMPHCWSVSWRLKKERVFPHLNSTLSISYTEHQMLRIEMAQKRFRKSPEIEVKQQLIKYWFTYKKKKKPKHMYSISHTKSLQAAIVRHKIFRQCFELRAPLCSLESIICYCMPVIPASTVWCMQSIYI